MHKLRRRIIRLSCILLTLTIAMVVIFYYGLTVNHYEIRTDKVRAPIRIAFVADVHSCFYGDGQKTLVNKIRAQNPDLVVLVGDIADDELPHERAIDLLSGIADIPSYYVTGNHEFWSDEIEKIKDIFRSHGAVVLEGDQKIVTVRDQTIVICGVDDPEVGEEQFSRQLQNALEPRDLDTYTILLAHRPERIEKYAEYGCDLVLSGHAHGGQFRIPFFMNGFFSPDQGYFPKYASGIYEVDDTKMLVSRGMARESTPLPRIFNPPELIVIDLIPE